ncbi:MAG TPA: thiamine pyrophosphate-binding protein [Burkholderiales bacterium]|jgi:acetolactate synthase-1/2/3 large subunit|nr:thiamine pyrophosphate-binding protein [Burkholderiales bacterium]
MQRMSGGRAVAMALKAEGIEHVFGIVGTHDSPLFDGVYGEPSIKVVTVRHEQGAALMADGYARASGRIAACFVVPGPGLTNALTGMGMAYSESTPMLVFGGQNMLAQLEREGGHFHELANSVQVAASVCGYATRVSTPGDLPKVIREAMRAMRCGRPRPAYIEVPLDVQTAEADLAPLPPETFRRPAGDPASVARAAQALSSAKRPFIFAGGGVESAGAVQPLARVAELLGAPVVTSVFGRGAISDRHPLALGDGWGRFDLYDELLAEADLALVVGSRIDVVSDWNVGAKFPGRIVQVDIDPLVVGQRRAVEVGIVGDAAAVLQALAAQLEGKARAPWFDADGFRRRKRSTLAQRAGPVLALIEDLRKALPDETIFVDDLTLVGYWMPLMMETYQPRTLIHPGTYGTLGYSLPAAIGAKLACPRQPVVSISGDGGFLFTLQELATARAENLDLIALVFNDNAYGAIRTYQDRMFGSRYIGCDLVNPDFVKLGEAFGAKSVRVEASELGGAVRRAHDSGGLWLIEVPFAPKGPVNRVPWMP